jgi:hypothetical protein
MAGLTPFLFTSVHELNETGRWFQMYINPTELAFTNTPMQSVTHTKGAVATTHWRNDLVKITAKGASGWILKESMVQSITQDLIHDVINGGDAVKTLKKYGQTILNVPQSSFNLSGFNNANTTARSFLKSLTDIALEDMYFTDNDGIEYYNQKKILVYTKQFPLGLIINGYFTNFVVPETAQDGQVINYSFNFTSETEDDSQQGASFLKNALKELLITANIKLS